MAGCNWLTTPEVCAAGEVGSRVTGGGSGSVWDAFVAWLAESAAATVRLVVAGWTEVPSPTLAGDTGAIPFLSAYLRPVTYLVLALAMMAAGARLAWEQRGEDASELAWSLVRFVLLTGLGATVVQALTVAGDEYSTWILNAATQGETGETLGERMTAITLTVVDLPGVGAGIAMFLFLAMIIAGIVQVGMIYARVPILVGFIVLWPVAAAAAITKSGKRTLSRYHAWFVAWILFKPTGSTVYAVGFVLIAEGDDGTSVIAGVVVLVITPFSLFALIRLFVPETAALSGSGGGGAAAGLGAAGGAVTAARSLSSTPPGAGSSGPMRARDATDGPTGAASPSGGHARAGAAVATTGKTAAAGAGGPAGAAAAAGTAVVKTASGAANKIVGEGGGDQS